MTAYRRNFIPGGCFFFTVNLADRRLRLLTENVEALRSAFRETRQRHPFTIDAMVRAARSSPYGLDDARRRSGFCKALAADQIDILSHLAAGEPVSASRAAKSERGIWQRRYWEHTIRDEDDLGRHIDYIHINPVKHGFVTRVSDWPHSSFHRLVKLGIYPEDWAGDLAELETNFGERS